MSPPEKPDYPGSMVLVRSKDDRDTTETLVQLFNQSFLNSERTQLIGGGKEPLYKPAADKGEFHQIIFREDYIASALHEIAHWCIAGVERRRKLDYGYWYSPDGRSRDRQRAFEAVEIKPQALEWLFASTIPVARFSISVDNLGGEAYDLTGFKVRVYRQALDYLANGLPERADRFIRVLQTQYGKKVTADSLSLEIL